MVAEMFRVETEVVGPGDAGERTEEPGTGTAYANRWRKLTRSEDVCR